MSVALSDRLNLYRITGGRRQVALAQVAERAQASWPDLTTFCRQAINHEEALRRLRQALATQQVRRVLPRLHELDPLIDRTVGAVYRVADEAANGLPPPLGDYGRTIVEELFPAGARAITTLAYPEQTTEIDSILKRLEDEEDLAPAASALGLTAYVAQLKSLNAEFSKVYNAGPHEGVSSLEVRSADLEGQDNLLQVVARILGRYPGRDAADVSARANLLAPVLRQNQAVHDYLRARRAVRDVDPVTGEEVIPVVDDTGTLQDDGQVVTD